MHTDGRHAPLPVQRRLVVVRRHRHVLQVNSGLGEVPRRCGALQPSLLGCESAHSPTPRKASSHPPSTDVRYAAAPADRWTICASSGVGPVGEAGALWAYRRAGHRSPWKFAVASPPVLAPLVIQDCFSAEHRL